MSIVSCDFDSDVSLLWLLGDSKGSLKSLTLSATTGLSSVVVEQMLLVGGSTLVELHLSIDRDDFTVPEDSDSLSASLFRNLKSLKKVTIGTDSVFGDGLWDELKGLGLERLESLTVCVPTVGFGKVESFVRGNRSEGLTELTVNTWYDFATLRVRAKEGVRADDAMGVVIERTGIVVKVGLILRGGRCSRCVLRRFLKRLRCL